MASNYQTIVPGTFAHVYNRAVGKDLMFRSHRDYIEFISKLENHIVPVANINAYCLMSNHFHLMLRLKETVTHKDLSAEMNRIQSTHASKYNFRYERKGGLFMSPFKRKPVKDDANLTWLLWYIHRNPLHHGWTLDWQNWPYSSYQIYANNQPSFVDTSYMINFFGGLQQLKIHHQLHEVAFFNREDNLSLE